MSETFNNHEEKTGEGWESLMASLAEEAGKFDPKRAEEARRERMANRMGGAHLKPESEKAEAGQRNERIGGDHLWFKNAIENRDVYSKEYREFVNDSKIDQFMKRMMVIENKFPVLGPLSDEEQQRCSNDKEYRAKINQMLDGVPEEVKKEHAILMNMVNELNDVEKLHPAMFSRVRTIPAWRLEDDDYGTMVVMVDDMLGVKQALAEMRELHEKNSKIIDFSHEDEMDPNSRLEDMRMPDEMQRRKRINEEGMAKEAGGKHLKPENYEGAKAERRVERVGGVHLSPEDRAEMEMENLYSREYREQVNAPISDLFTKRRVVMEERFPGLKSFSSGEELWRYYNDKEYRARVDQMRDEVPKEVKEEHDLLGLMVGRLDDGIGANLKSDDSLAGGEPNSIPMGIAEEGYGEIVVTKWKAEHAKQDLARLRELHKKNSEIIDFSHENEVDLNSISEDAWKKVENLKGEIEALKTAEYRDFKSSGDKRPKTAVILDKISDLSRIDNLSYEMRKTINQQKYEFRKAYLRAENAAELRDIDMRIEKLQQEKTKIAERQKKYADAGFVAKMFGRLFDSNRTAREEEQLGSIDRHLKKLDERTQRLRKVAGNE